mmetsp:Transcript_67020/g.188763  ORF Transcript_67020/g.188763 Transcript_67020/m.188763 type:complete len:213 (+) Transcript_67020:79-717(+)
MHTRAPAGKPTELKRIGPRSTGRATQAHPGSGAHMKSTRAPATPADDRECQTSRHPRLQRLLPHLARPITRPSPPQQQRAPPPRPHCRAPCRQPAWARPRPWPAPLAWPLPAAAPRSTASRSVRPLSVAPLRPWCLRPATPLQRSRLPWVAPPQSSPRFAAELALRCPPVQALEPLGLPRRTQEWSPVSRGCQGSPSASVPRQRRTCRRSAG